MIAVTTYTVAEWRIKIAKTKYIKQTTKKGMNSVPKNRPRCLSLTYSFKRGKAVAV